MAQLELNITAATARDNALALVTENNEAWSTRALKAVRMLDDWSGTGEELRLLISRIVGQPAHHNAWGALIMQALKRDYLVATGEWRSMTTVKSHARKTPVYRSVP